MLRRHERICFTRPAECVQSARRVRTIFRAAVSCGFASTSCSHRNLSAWIIAMARCPSCCAIGEIRKKTSGQSSARTANSRARTSRPTVSRFFVLLSWFLFVPAQVRGIQDHCRHPVGNAIVDLRRKDVVLAAGKKVERAGVRPVVHD